MAGRATQLTRRVVVETDDANARVTQLSRRTAVESVANVRVTQVSRRLVLARNTFSLEAVLAASGAGTVSSSLTANAINRRPDIPGSFTMSAVLLRGHDSLFSADAIRRFAIAGTCSVDAIIGKSSTIGANANAVILKPAALVFSADAVLSVSYSTVDADWTVDAVVRTEAVRFASIDSVIRRVIAPDFGLDAVTRLPDIAGDFGADAIIAAGVSTQVGSFSVNSLIATRREVSFAANAVILKSIFRDDFNRTVAKGLGGEWSWYWMDSSASSSEDQFSSVDGLALNIVSPFVGGNVYDSHVGFPLPATGDLAFDFEVPATPDAWDTPVYGFVLNAFDYTGIIVAKWASGWMLQTWTGAAFSFVPTPSTWYRVHARWTDTMVYARVWPVADPEPGTWDLETINEWALALDTETPPFLDLYNSPEGPIVGKLDNIEFWSSQSQWTKYGGFQIGAVIDSPTKERSFSAAAVIFKTVEISPSFAGSVDTFTEAVSVSLDEHIPDSGPMWSSVNGVVVYDNKWWPASDGASWSWLLTGQHDYDIEFDYFGYNGSVGLFLRDEDSINAVAAVVGRDDTGDGWAIVAEMLDSSYSYSNNKNGFFSNGTVYRIRVTLTGDEAAIYVDGTLADSLTLTHEFASTDLRVSANYGNVIDNWNFPYPLPGTSFSADAVIYDGSFQGSFTAKAAISDGHHFSYFVASAIIDLPPIPRVTSISIKINGIDITDDVVIEDAEFTSQASGASPGTCSFRLKDRDHLYTFIVGQTLTLDINGRRVWGGWVQNVSRQFFFPVPCIGVATELPRAWKIEGIDYNILFRKRFCSNKTNRPDMELKSWPADTDDSTQIHYLCEHHLDLEGDGIDYTTMVDHVGSPNPDARGNAYAASWSWEAAMSNIAQYPGAIYYIDANKRLVYADVDTVSADYPMTDMPTARQVGYREMEIVYNGSQLVNDALVWGAGQGSAQIKFSRARDDASIAAHGLWQHGDFRADMWRQASVDKRADGFVFGSPQNKRGGKDDAVSVIATVFDPVYSAGEKVNFTSHVYGFSDVIPIRQMKTTFPTKFDARFDLVLSHYIDQPWNTSEFWFPKIVIEPPDIHILPPGGTGQCPVVTNPQTFESPDGTIYQVGGPWSTLFTDDFNRSSGTQPNDSEFGYWGNQTGAPSAPYFDASGLPLSGANLWFTQPITGGIQIIAKLFIPENHNWDIGGLFGVTYANGKYGFWVIGGAPFEEDQSLRTGDVFVRFVYTKSQFVAARIWRQDLPEPTKWSSTNTSALLMNAVANIAMTGYYPATLQAITVFVDDDIAPVPSNEFDVWRPTPGMTGTGWSHSFQFYEPYPLYWEAGNYDDFWAVSWGTYSSNQESATNHPSHTVRNVWSYYHCYGQYAYQAGQETAVALVPLDRVFSSIRVSGTVSVAVQYSILVSLNQDRPMLSVPVTVNFDVYDYETEPYWIGEPTWAALGRTAGSVLAVPVTGRMDQGGHSVDVPFSFDVPADMLTEIAGSGLLKWGIKVLNPFDTLNGLPKSPESTQWLIANTLDVSASVVGQVSYSASYIPPVGPSYFCIPPSTQGGTGQQRVCESFQLANIGLTLEAMPDGSYDVPTLVREITLTSTYLSGSVEVTADGMLARPGVDFVEKNAALGQVTLLNDFNGVKAVVVCYFPGSTQDWDYWHRLVM